MERLTFKVHDGGIFVKESDIKTFDVEDEIIHTGNAIRTLATYEDTGLTPEQIIEMDKLYAEKCRELLEYKRLDKQGLLLKLPCKVGDTVYVKLASYCDSKYAYAEVRDFTYFLTCGFCIVVTSDKFDKQNIPFTEFGKTVFLTQAEAEESFKRLEESHAGSI